MPADQVGIATHVYMATVKEIKRTGRHKRIRVKIKGTAERPRLVIFRSLKNMQAQLIDDTQEKTIFLLSTTSKKMKEKLGYSGNVKAANSLGEEFAKLAIAKGVKSIVFDRAGYAYHGRVKAFAEALRKGGVVF